MSIKLSHQQRRILAYSIPVLAVFAALIFGAISPASLAARDPAVPPYPAAMPGEVDLAGLRIGYFEDDGFLTPVASSAPCGSAAM